jgi:hypothetical protein
MLTNNGTFLPESDNFMETAEERRIAQRVLFKEAVRYELTDPACFKGCVAYDLSESGVRLRLTEFLPLGTQVVLSIRLKEGKLVECMGRIVWISQIPFMDHFKAGVEFLQPELIQMEKRKIRQFITYNNQYQKV